jgi:hypothetical protein
MPETTRDRCITPSFSPSTYHRGKLMDGKGCFARWAQSLTNKLEREVVAIDGKTVRRSGSRRHNHGPLHPGFTHQQSMVESDAKPGSCKSSPVLRGAAVPKPQGVINVQV